MIDEFYRTLLPSFFQAVPQSREIWDAQRFDRARFRSYVESVIAQARTALATLEALATEESLSAASSKLIALLPGELIVETSLRGETKRQLVSKLRENVSGAIAKAFIGGQFHFTIEETETL